MPEDREIAKKNITDAIEKKMDLENEYRISGKNGAIKWIRATGQIFYEKNVPVRMTGLCMDITQSKLSAEKYKLVLENATVGFADHEMIFDDNGNPVDYRFLELNPAFENMTGLRSEHTVGKTVKEMLPGTEQYWIDTYGDVVKTGMAVSYENFSKELEKYYQVWAFRSGINKFAVFVTDVTERKEYEQKIKSALKDKEILLRELYHRTKNNMQIISSYLHLQSLKKDMDLNSLVSDTVSRIYTMSLVHERLQRTHSLSDINLGDYMRDLVESIKSSYSISVPDVSVYYEIDVINTLFDIALSLGLVVNEIITNSFKHAFKKNGKGNIFINLYRNANDEILLIISDNGKGFPKDADLRKSNSFGMEIIFDIVEKQLQGTANYDITDGMKWIITFKDNVYRKRVDDDL